jgi:hypothetical protein
MAMPSATPNPNNAAMWACILKNPSAPNNTITGNAANKVESTGLSAGL